MEALVSGDFQKSSNWSNAAAVEEPQPVWLDVALIGASAFFGVMCDDLLWMLALKAALIGNILGLVLPACITLALPDQPVSVRMIAKLCLVVGCVSTCLGLASVSGLLGGTINSKHISRMTIEVGRIGSWGKGENDL